MEQEPKLTPKQSAFVDAYCSNGGNGKQACIDAGYSSKVAHVQSNENLNKPNVQKAIQLRQKPIAEKRKITRESLLAEIEEGQQMAKDLGKPEVFIRGAEIKAKMLGLNEPQKIELSGTIKTKIVRKFGERHAD